MSKLNACCNKALNSVMNKDKILQKYSTHNVNHTIQFTKYINEHKYLMYFIKIKIRKIEYNQEMGKMLIFPLNS